MTLSGTRRALLFLVWLFGDISSMDKIDFSISETSCGMAGCFNFQKLPFTNNMLVYCGGYCYCIT